MQEEDMMMKLPLFLIVGDAFEEFARHCDATKYNDLISSLDLSDLTGWAFLFGQGLSSEQMTEVVEYLESRGARILNGNMDRRADGALSHKRKERNTLISAPQLVGDSLYRASRLVDARSELMSDHQTGLHLQGMLQVEAYRQFMLALFEAFYPLANKQESHFRKPVYHHEPQSRWPRSEAADPARITRRPQCIRH